MKRTLRILQLFALLLLFLFNNFLINAQEISNFEIIPENPGTSDEVFFIVTTSFSFVDCTLDSVHHFYACGAYAMDAFYSTGFDLGDCERTDTISMGNLVTGPCMISFRMYYLGWSQVDQVDTFITVGSVGIDHLIQGSEKEIKIWPNPSYGRVNFSVENKLIDKLFITQITGNFKMVIDLKQENLNTVSLLPGMYVCTAFHDEQPISVSKFIVMD